MKKLFLFASLVASSVYAVGSNRPLSPQELTMATLLWNHHTQIDTALKKAGVQGEVKFSEGTAFEGGMPDLQTQGYSFSVSQCGAASGPACRVLGTLTVTDLISSGSESVNVKFEPVR